MSSFFWTDHWSSLCLSSIITPWGSLLARNQAACGWAGSLLTTISTTWTSTSPRSGQWQWPWGMNKATSTAGAREVWGLWEAGHHHWASGSEASLLLFLFSSCLFSSNGFCSAFFLPPLPFPFLLFCLLLLFHLALFFLPHLLSLFSPLCSPSFSSFQNIPPASKNSSSEGLRIWGEGFQCSGLQVVEVWGWALRSRYSNSLGKEVSRVQNALTKDPCTDHSYLLQPQVQQLLHGVGRRLCKLRAAGPDQPHRPCHWLPGGLGHWPNDLYSQWQREQHFFPGEPIPFNLAIASCLSILGQPSQIPLEPRPLKNRTKTAPKTKQNKTNSTCSVLKTGQSWQAPGKQSSWTTQWTEAQKEGDRT